MARGFSFRLPTFLDDLPYVGEEFEQKGTKTDRRRRPSSLYDVPVPPSQRPKVTKEIEKRRLKREEEERQRPTRLGPLPIPDVGVQMGLGLPFGIGPTLWGPRLGARPVVGDVKELASGFPAAAKTVIEAFGKDAPGLARLMSNPQRELAKTKSKEGGISKKTLEDYKKLLEWSYSDDPKKGKPPDVPSAVFGFLTQIAGGTGRSVADDLIVNPFDPADVRRAKRAWGEDPVFSALDAMLLGSIVSRPASAIVQTSRIARANQISRGKAVRAGVEESFRPGAAKRKGLEGGIAPRVLHSDVGSVPGRPWSRSPLVRQLQREYDKAWASDPRRGNRRVGAAQQRLENEQERRVRLESDELTRPIARFVYGPIGRMAGAFGLRKNMSAQERRRATALMYVLQMPQHHAPTEALEAIEKNLTRRLQSGHIELPSEDGRRVRRTPLTEEQKHHLSQQIEDLNLARSDFDSGEIDPEEFQEAVDALAQVAKRNDEMGLDIMERFQGLDPDALDEIAEMWTRRSQILPRHLAGQGDLAYRSVYASEERAAWLDVLENAWGEEQARAAIVAADALARKARPQNPASWYADRVGHPTAEGAKEFVDRVGSDALFQMFGREGSRQISGERKHLAEGEIGLDAEGNIVDVNVFHSPVQKWVAESWDKRYQTDNVSAKRLRDDVKAQTPAQEWENGGLETYFNSLPAGAKVNKQEFQEHLSNALNAYNLEEHFFVKQEGDPYEFSGQSHTRDPQDFRTSFDSFRHGALNSRDPQPGEYAELVMRLHPDARPGDRNYGGWRDQPSAFQGDHSRMEGFLHWGHKNVVAHSRFQIFEEDGVVKMLIDEIQSDWTANARQHPARHLPEEMKEEAARLQQELDAITEEGDRLDDSQTPLLRKVDQLEDDRMRLRAARDEAKEGSPELAEILDKLQLNKVNLDAFKKMLNENERKLDRLENKQMELEDKIEEISDEGVAPSALGPKYYRTVLRRLMREAVENGVDEIIFQDPVTQLVRGLRDSTAKLRPKSLQGSAKTPLEVYDELKVLLSQAEETAQAADRRILAANEGKPELSKGQYNSKLTAKEREAKDLLRSYKTWHSLYAEQFPNFLKKEFGLELEPRRNAYQGRMSQEDHPRYDDGAFSAEGDMPGLVLKVNDRMRQQVKNSQAQYQRSPNYGELPRGAVELLSDQRTQMHIFSEGGIDTWMHELGHIALYDLDADDLGTVKNFFGGGKDPADWTTAQHENFARTFERYWREGRAPNPELASVFAKISAWMKEVWKQTKERQPQLTDEIRELFDRMLPDDGPTDELETYGYFPHRDLYEIAEDYYKGATRMAATGNVAGRPRLTGKALQKQKNELLLYQTGRLNPDPAGLVDVFLRRQRFITTLDARQHLFDEIGHELSEPMPADAWLVRRPTGPAARITEQMRAPGRGQELTRPHEPDLDDRLTLSPKEFQDEVIGRASEKKDWLKDDENVRWVPGEYVKARYPDVFSERPRGSGPSFVRTMNSLARITGIYGRPIAYAAGNIPFNVMALLATMPAANLRSAQQMIRLARRDPALYRAINSEAGQTRAESSLPGVSYVKPQGRAQRAEQRTQRFQRGMADALSSFSDDPFRATAFLSNARKRGYSSDEELWDLINSDGTDLADVRQLTREQLLDFDALNPMQRKMASDWLYLWPFMYAATKWPMMYAREYPLRAGVAAEAIQQEPERLNPLEVANFWKSKGIDLSAVNPLGPIGGMASDLDQLLKDPSKMDLTVGEERLPPFLGAAVTALSGGKENLLQNLIRSTVPGASEAAAFIGEDWRGSKMYDDRDTPWGYLKTRHLRFAPRELNEAKMEEAIAEAKKDELTGTTLERKKQADSEKVMRYAKALGGVEDTEALERSFTAWWEYQEALDQKKDSTGQRKLNPVQQAEILDEVVREHFPEYSQELYPLDTVREADPKALEGYVTALREIVNEGRKNLFDDYRSYAAPEQ